MKKETIDDREYFQDIESMAKALAPLYSRDRWFWCERLDRSRRIPTWEDILMHMKYLIDASKETDFCGSGGIDVRRLPGKIEVEHKKYGAICLLMQQQEMRIFPPPYPSEIASLVIEIPDSWPKKMGGKS